jgi:hypothetical protein
MDGSGLREKPDYLTTTINNFNENNENYFQKNNFESIQTNDQLFEWMEVLLNQKLWHPAGERNPNWPVGATRLIQYRVKVPEDCIDSSNSTTCHDLYGTGGGKTNQEELMDCLDKVYSYRCNPPFN